MEITGIEIKVQRVKWIKGKAIPTGKPFTPQTYLTPNASVRRM